MVLVQDRKEMGNIKKMTKLKTLKDLEEEERNEFAEVGDLDNYSDYSYVKIKQEAIKRVKYYKEERDQWDIKKFPNEWYFLQGKVGAEMFAHNITEGDLKDNSPRLLDTPEDAGIHNPVDSSGSNSDCCGKYKQLIPPANASESWGYCGTNGIWKSCQDNDPGSNPGKNTPEDTTKTTGTELRNDAFQSSGSNSEGCGKYYKEKDRICGNKYGYKNNEKRSYIKKKTSFDIWICKS